MWEGITYFPANIRDTVKYRHMWDEKKVFLKNMWVN